MKRHIIKKRHLFKSISPLILHTLFIFLANDECHPKRNACPLSGTIQVPILGLLQNLQIAAQLVHAPLMRKGDNDTETGLASMVGLIAMQQNHFAMSSGPFWTFFNQCIIHIDYVLFVAISI